MLPEESRQDVPYAQGGVQAAVGRRDREQGWEWGWRGRGNEIGKKEEEKDLPASLLWMG